MYCEIALWVLVAAIIVSIAVIVYNTLSKPALKIKRLSSAPDQQDNKPIGVGGVIIVILFFLVFLAIIGVGIWITLKRYQLVGEAIRSGRSELAMGMMAPELGQGIGIAASGIGNAFRR